ncbi:serine/threonine-protein kinase [Actinomadura geliboluensis]|uniref:serine/threonine-protein kinase n=1 Tax=Actinomadura geliboluensis TaxID=882440 RepID=UPI00371D4B04
MSGAGLKALRAGDPEQVGPYRLLARLGAGGMGRVYLGRSPGRRLVAVKVVHPHFADNASFRRRFAKEVAAARRIGGFYTAHVVDADPDADPPWLVTEYIAGPTLQEAVDENGPLPEASVAALGAGLAEGLGAVHEQHVIHRDLKPGNVLLARDGARIIDFGIARAMDATSQSLTLVGTPGYMSPEQYLGGDIGPASDVFCLAAVLTFAATGRHPFGEGPPDALGYRVRHEEPDLAGIPAALLELVAAGLEKDPDDRPPTEEFLERCSALAPDEGMSLPKTFDTMIATRVAETEVFAGSVGAGAKSEPKPPPRPKPKAPPKPKAEPKAPPRPKAQQPKAQAQGQAQPPPRPPQQQPPRPPVKQPAPAGGIAAGVIGVLLVVLLIAVAAQDRSGSSGNAGASSSTSSSPTSTGTRTSGLYGGSDPTGSSSPTPTPDPTFEAFDAIRVGDCLDAYQDPYDSSEWSEDEPTAVSCGRSDAYLKVYGVEDSGSGCDAEALDGEDWWSSPYHDGERIYLCVRRQFREGECFLGKKSTKNGSTAAINGHGLMTSWGCGKSTVPRGFNYILQFTGYYESTCPSGSLRWTDFRKGVLCARIV